MWNFEIAQEDPEMGMDIWLDESREQAIVSQTAEYAKYGAELEYNLYTTINTPARIASEVAELFEGNILVGLRLISKTPGVERVVHIGSGKSYSRPVLRSTLPTVPVSDLMAMKSARGLAAEITAQNKQLLSEILEEMKELQSQFGTSLAVFYSGKPKINGEIADGITVTFRDAVAFARANGGKTIEMTDGGQWLLQKIEANKHLLHDTQTGALWVQASKYFAQKATGGTAFAFVEHARPDRVFWIF